MKHFIPILTKTRLFAGVSEPHLLSMLSCLGAKLGRYQKGEYVLRQGEQIGHVLVLAQGELHIQNDDYWGNRSILGKIAIGETFGEAYAAQSTALINDVVATQDSAVIFFDVQRILTTCSSACVFHSAVIQNMFFSVAEKNRKLVEKLAHVTKRTTREKLISYLSEEAKKQNSPYFTIPFNRQQLADYLSVDRSAMSDQLCRMRDEGLLEFEKNRFKLL